MIVDARTANELFQLLDAGKSEDASKFVEKYKKNTNKIFFLICECICQKPNNQYVTSTQVQRHVKNYVKHKGIKLPTSKKWNPVDWFSSLWYQCFPPDNEDKQYKVDDAKKEQFEDYRCFLTRMGEDDPNDYTKPAEYAFRTREYFEWCKGYFDGATDVTLHSATEPHIETLDYDTADFDIPTQQQEEGSHTLLAVEGLLTEYRYLNRSRNRQLANERKRLDHFTCQVCGWSFEINGQHIIECHHLSPLGENNTETVVTSLDDLISLCPNCHRCLHSRTPPIALEALRELIVRGRRES